MNIILWPSLDCSGDIGGSRASEPPLLYNLKNEYHIIDVIRLFRGGGGGGGAWNGVSEPPLLYNLKNEYHIDVIRLFREYRESGFGRRGRVSGASEPPLLYNLKNEYHIIDVIKLFWG